MTQLNLFICFICKGDSLFIVGRATTNQLKCKIESIVITSFVCPYSDSYGRK